MKPQLKSADLNLSATAGLDRRECAGEPLIYRYRHCLGCGHLLLKEKDSTGVLD